MRVVAPGGTASRVFLEASGWAGCGVDLFFVLSGFLIGGILMEARGTANYFRRFYWRRSLRIFPAFYALLLFAVLITPFAFQRTGFPWFALYLRNWLGADYVSDGLYGHLWSLAVEEQFYIGWSIVVFFFPRRYLMHLIVALIALAPVVRAVMHSGGYAGYLIFRVTPARMDSLLCGALVAAAVRSSWNLRVKRIGFTGILAGLAGLVLLRLMAGAIGIDVPSYQVAWPSLIALLFASVLLLCLHLEPGGLAHTLLTCSPFRTVAKYSYAIYLWHLVAASVARAVLRPIVTHYPSLAGVPYAVSFVILACGLSFAAAAASWKVIEQPALNFKDRFFPSAAPSVPVPMTVWWPRNRAAGQLRTQSSRSQAGPSNSISALPKAQSQQF